jgi:5,10-methylenetetrahydrofolate reductase
MDRDQLKRLQARYARRAGPIGLTPEELDLDNAPMQVDVHGIPVKAWIRFQDCSELIEGLAHTWTQKAVQVSWTDGPLRRSTWVWASAVTRTKTLDRTLGERTNNDSSTD